MKRILTVAGLPVLAAVGVLLWLGRAEVPLAVQLFEGLLIVLIAALIISMRPALAGNSPTRSSEMVRPLQLGEYSLREVVNRTLEPFRMQAAKKGVQLVVGVPDSIPDRFTGTGAGLEKVIVRQVSDIVNVATKGYIIFEVTSSRQSDGRMKFRFRAGTVSSADKTASLLAGQQGQPQLATGSGSLTNIYPFRAQA